jgi:hypothetical protein
MEVQIGNARQAAAEVLEGRFAGNIGRLVKQRCEAGSPAIIVFPTNWLTAAPPSGPIP